MEPASGHISSSSSSEEAIDIDQTDDTASLGSKLACIVGNCVVEFDRSLLPIVMVSVGIVGMGVSIGLKALASLDQNERTCFDYFEEFSFVLLGSGAAGMVRNHLHSNQLTD